MDELITLTNMTVGEFKNFQRALRILMSVGLNQVHAAEILCAAAKQKQQEKRERKN